MNLMVYSENRDHFKTFCNNGRAYKNSCLYLSQNIEKTYKKISEDYICIKGTINDKIYAFHFSNNCTLYDLPNTFPLYDSQNEQIL